jgi:uncharacterized protein YprB with RNaseH-like and TPR domain
MSLSNKLNRFKKQLTVDKPAHPNSPKVSEYDTIHYDEKWEKFGAKSHYFDGQCCMVREIHYPLDYQYGNTTFHSLYDVVEQWNTREGEHPLSSKGREASDLIFFDTETTGLGSGTGNTIFLIGMARIISDQVIVRQFFLPQPGDEVALYHYFLTDTNNMKNLVTYNGKAFDWPQVKTRHTFVRDAVPTLPAFGHFDLLHGARRLWKHSYDSLRLSVVEKEILSIERSNDTPGYLAPMLYFEFLREKDPDIIEGVLRHNEMDVLTLITLYSHISKLLLQPLGASLSSAECYEVGRWYAAAGDTKTAFECFSNLASTENAMKAKSKKTLGMIFKKRGDLEEAVRIWEELVTEESRVDSDVLIELAKAYEHHYKDYEKALHYAEKAYDDWKSSRRLLRKTSETERTMYMKRIERLSRK